jgi:hypothetical protein
MLKNRKKFELGHGDFSWSNEHSGETSLGYVNSGVLVLANFDGDSIAIPSGEVLLSTQDDLSSGLLAHDQVVWIKL